MPDYNPGPSSQTSVNWARGLSVTWVDNTGTSLEKPDGTTFTLGPSGGGEVWGTSISAAPAAGPTANYAPTGYVAGTTNRLLLTPSAAATISGLLSPGVDGFSVVIVNLSATYAITFTHQDSGSLAANRFQLAGAVSSALGTTASALAIWVSGTGWVFV
jgi:hypothetical protein